MSRPPPAAATSFDLYVRGLLPTTTGLTLGQIAQVNLTGNENFFIYWMHNPLTQFLFNSSQLLPGQSVAIGGPASGATNPQAVTVKRVVLRHWGFNGTVVAGSVNPRRHLPDAGQRIRRSPDTRRPSPSMSPAAPNFRDGLTAIQQRHRRRQRPRGRPAGQGPRIRPDMPYAGPLRGSAQLRIMSQISQLPAGASPTGSGIFSDRTSRSALRNFFQIPIN